MRFRKFLITTAATTLLAGGAYAQTAPQPAPAEPAPAVEAPAVETPIEKSGGQLATSIIGETVYSGTGPDAVNIGDVNDLVVGANGAIEQLIVGVGGFLGIGEKSVAIDYKTAAWAEQNGERWLVVETSKEALEAAPEFDRTPYLPQAPETAAADPAAPIAPGAGANPAPQAPPPANTPTDSAAAPADPAPAPADTMQAAPAEQMTAAIDKSTLTEVPAANITSEQLAGTRVFGAQDVDVGEIGDVVMSADGKVEAVVVDVGGFLGIGEKPVAVGFDNLAFMSDQDGKHYLYTTFTKEQLEAQPAYDEATFAQDRDKQLLKITQ